MNKPAVSVDVFELAREGSRVQGEVPPSALPRLAAELIRPDGELQYELRGMRDAQGRPAAELVLRGALWLRCDRCMEPVKFALDRQTGFFFVRSEAELNSLPIVADELDADEDIEPLIGSERFDVLELVEDEALLSLPLSPKHASCQAAIPLGSEVEDEPDGAPRKNPFAALAVLKQGRSKS